MNSKEPWLAVNLSSLLPGMGQLYGGQRRRGWLWLGAFLLLAVSGVYCLFVPSQSAFLGGALLLAAGLLQVINLFDAFRTVRRANPNDFEHDRIRHKDPWKAFFLSRLFLGLGHAYAGHWIEAIAFWVMFVFFMFLGGLLGPPGFLLPLGFGVYCAYHAYSRLVARRPQMARTWVLPVCLAVLAYEGISGLPGLTFETRYLPTESMSPTLQLNDRVLINKFYRVPKRGDIVIFYPPEEAMPQGQTGQEVFIKRVIGLPGETVEVKDGQVSVDNQSLHEDYIQEPMSYQWGPETLTEEQYFLLGDNRNQSFDSHVFGVVRRNDIIGHATKIWWPFKRSGAL